MASRDVYTRQVCFKACFLHRNQSRTLIRTLSKPTVTLASHSDPVVSFSPASTSTTHSKRPSFSYPFRRPPYTIAPSASSASRPFPLARCPPRQPGVPPLASAPRGQRITQDGADAPLIIRQGHAIGITSSRSSNGCRSVAVVQLRCVVAAHFSNDTMKASLEGGPPAALSGLSGGESLAAPRWTSGAAHYRSARLIHPRYDMSARVSPWSRQILAPRCHCWLLIAISFDVVPLFRRYGHYSV